MPLPPNNLKAPPFQQIRVFPISDLARQMEEHCRTHRAARVHPLQTPLWCDRFENCLDCIMKFLNNYQPPKEK